MDLPTAVLALEEILRAQLDHDDTNRPASVWVQSESYTQSLLDMRAKLQSLQDRRLARRIVREEDAFADVGDELKDDLELVSLCLIAGIDLNTEQYFTPSEHGLLEGPKLLECVVCINTIQIFNAVKLPCSDVYCRECITRLFAQATKSEAAFPPRCHRIEIPLARVERLLPSDLVQLFREKVVEFRTPGADRLYCAIPHCSAFILPSRYDKNKDRAVECPRCASFTCTRCKSTRHDGDCPKKSGFEEVLRLAEENQWQRCTACGRMVELTQGCDHITCHCGAQFCYRCGATWGSCQCSQLPVVNALGDLHAFDRMAVDYYPDGTPRRRVYPRMPDWEREHDHEFDPNPRRRQINRTPRHGNGEEIRRFGRVVRRQPGLQEIGVGRTAGELSRVGQGQATTGRVHRSDAVSSGFHMNVAPPPGFHRNDAIHSNQGQTRETLQGVTLPQELRAGRQYNDPDQSSLASTRPGARTPPWRKPLEAGQSYDPNQRSLAKKKPGARVLPWRKSLEVGQSSRHPWTTNTPNSSNNNLLGQSSWTRPETDAERQYRQFFTSQGQPEQRAKAEPKNEWWAGAPSFGRFENGVDPASGRSPENPGGLGQTAKPLPPWRQPNAESSASGGQLQPRSGAGTYRDYRPFTGLPAPMPRGVPAFAEHKIPTPHEVPDSSRHAPRDIRDTLATPRPWLSKSWKDDEPSAPATQAADQRNAGNDGRADNHFIPMPILRGGQVFMETSPGLPVGSRRDDGNGYQTMGNNTISRNDGASTLTPALRQRPWIRELKDFMRRNREERQVEANKDSDRKADTTAPSSSGELPALVDSRSKLPRGESGELDQDTEME